MLPKNGWEGQLIGKPTGATVLVIDVGDIRTKEQGSAVWRFVRDGGGLLIGSPGWGWLQLHRGQTLDEDHPGNLLLSRRGIVWTAGTISKTGERGFLLNRELLEACNANKALEILRLHDDGKQRPSEETLRVAAHTLEEAATAFGADDRWIVPKLKTLVKDRSTTVPTAKSPLRREDVLARVTVAWRIRAAAKTPPEEVRADPTATVFPGAVPAERNGCLVPSPSTHGSETGTAWGSMRRPVK